MDFDRLSRLLFPDITETQEDWERTYPPRDLPQGAIVTRMAPSPTGFMHLGNLFGAITDERLAHQSGGVFLLRIEDTDQKREVPGGVETILSAFERFGLRFDEGATLSGDRGKYGPYRQRQRARIYQSIAKRLLAEGKAYPCFCTEDELARMRERQEAEKANFGYYGKWAVHRNLTLEEIESQLKAEKPFVLRFKSPGNNENRVTFHDLIRGEIEFPENDQDIVLLKSDGIPTYHFAHVVDDHFMRVTHVVRGEEWLSTLPVHVQLFEALGWERPAYAHTAHLMKMESGSKRKLSKRKDPELALDFYYEQGYPTASLTEYLMMLLNSNFEEWRLANPSLDIREFPFSIDKMSGSGALFDLDKLNDVSKNTIAAMDADAVYEQVCAWAKQYDAEFYDLFSRDPEYTKAILSIGRGGEKPRKDITVWSGVRGYMDFFFDELFCPEALPFPENVITADRLEILERYKAIYDAADDQQTWFGKIKELSAKLGFAPEVKLYKKNPQDYKGHVGDVSMVLRVAVTGRTSSPDMHQAMKILGSKRVIERLDRARAFA